MSNRMTAVTEYFHRELVKRGYPVEKEKVSWSLSYSQGDGMAFYGTLGTSEVMGLAKRLLARKHYRALWRAVDREFELECSITRNSYGSHYSHYNTMDVAFEGYGHSGEEMTPLQKEAWKELRENIEADVCSTSKELAENGYKLLKAGEPMWWDGGRKECMNGDERGFVYATHTVGRFTVDVRVFEDNDFNVYEFDDEQQVQDMIDGKVVAYQLQVRVRAGGRELASAWCGAITDYPDLRYAREVARDLLREAVSETRDSLNELAVKPNKEA